MMTNHLSTFLRDITDNDIMRLIKELEDVTRVRYEPYLHTDMLHHYLQTCVRPNGASMPQVPISKQMLDAQDFDNSYMMRNKVGKLKDTQVYWVCHELACFYRIGFEPVLSKSLYVFLNQCLKEAPKKKKKAPPRNILWK